MAHYVTRSLVYFVDLYKFVPLWAPLRNYTEDHREYKELHREVVS